MTIRAAIVLSFIVFVSVVLFGIFVAALTGVPLVGAVCP